MSYEGLWMLILEHVWVEYILVLQVSNFQDENITKNTLAYYENVPIKNKCFIKLY